LTGTLARLPYPAPDTSIDCIHPSRVAVAGLICVMEPVYIKPLNKNTVFNYISKDINLIKAINS
jgi:hypothetical protein